jgi:hypothetical protein
MCFHIFKITKHESKLNEIDNLWSDFSDFSLHSSKIFFTASFLHDMNIAKETLTNDDEVNV